MHLIQEIGSYAGLAAIPGLAILSALYFSQARDVRRLRDWAGRAPERASETAQGGRVTARPAAAAQPAAAPQPATAAVQPAAAQPAPGAVAASTGGGTATAAPPRTTAPAVAPGGPRRIAPSVPGGGRTAILGPAAAAQPEPWYRRAADRLPAARYIAIALVGIAVVGGGIAYGITQLGKDSSSGHSATPAASNIGAKPQQSARPAPLAPSDVSVSVINDTTVAGLAASYASKLNGIGFKVINKVTGAQQGTVAESVVKFKPGHTRDAKLVARKLSISQLEPADATTAGEGGPANVVVVLGDNLAHQQP